MSHTYLIFYVPNGRPNDSEDRPAAPQTSLAISHVLEKALSGCLALLYEHLFIRTLDLSDEPTQTGANEMKSTITTVKNAELRKANRYRLGALVFFYWATPNGPAQSGQGTTRDINSHGVYVQADKSPPVGALVQMDILLPKLAYAGPGMHLTGEGVVLRVDRSDPADPAAAPAGFAASVQFYPEAADLMLSHLKTTGRVV
jgi:hypothetical protein